MMEMACSSELQGAAEWFSTVQMSVVRLRQIVAMLRTTVTRRMEPSLSWIQSVHRCMLENIRGLEEGPAPHLEAYTDRLRLRPLRRRCCEELEEGHGLCGTLEEQFFEDDDDIVEGLHNNNVVADDDAEMGSDDNDNRLIYITQSCNINKTNNTKENNELTVAVEQGANNNYTVRAGGMGGGILSLCTLGNGGAFDNDNNNNNSAGDNTPGNDSGCNNNISNNNTAGDNQNNNNKEDDSDSHRVMVQCGISILNAGVIDCCPATWGSLFGFDPLARI
ncbi:hypothetical protein CBR_g3246 [Chara braunii]|uniref:Uncharacterized protein n=1 Tax=Chara braunii TaxID=69332 RepID=A0A388KF65_CHABU|nr:hypothetical protein CBR_g3246 [Chara braunii]|eukprot:GBG68704.1 hypothetical protein CBR_g3246 [Chara braunii]